MTVLFCPSRPKLNEALAAVLDWPVARLGARDELVRGLRSLDQNGPRNPREAWETLAARDLIPMDWVQAPRRVFVHESRVDGDEHGQAVVRYRAEFYPPSVAMCVALASNVPNVVQCEALAWELAGMFDITPEQLAWEPQTLAHMRRRAAATSPTVTVTTLGAATPHDVLYLFWALAAQAFTARWRAMAWESQTPDERSHRCLEATRAMLATGHGIEVFEPGGVVLLAQVWDNDRPR